MNSQYSGRHPAQSQSMIAATFHLLSITFRRGSSPCVNSEVLPLVTQRIYPCRGGQGLDHCGGSDESHRDLRTGRKRESASGGRNTGPHSQKSLRKLRVERECEVVLYSLRFRAPAHAAGWKRVCPKCSMVMFLEHSSYSSPLSSQTSAHRRPSG